MCKVFVLNQMVKEIKIFKLDVTVPKETKNRGEGADEFQDFVHFYSRVEKDIRAAEGVSILIQKRLSWNSWD